MGHLKDKTPVFILFVLFFFLDANELKKISQMWQEMNQHYKTTCLELR